MYFLIKYGNREAFDLFEVGQASLNTGLLNNTFRHRILVLLESHGPLTVTQILIQLKSAQLVISPHLAILRRHQVVNTVRNGNQILYELNSERIMEIGKLLQYLHTN